jgi:hypothetical protein
MLSPSGLSQPQGVVTQPVVKSPAPAMKTVMTKQNEIFLIASLFKLTSCIYSKITADLPDIQILLMKIESRFAPKKVNFIRKKGQIILNTKALD